MVLSIINEKGGVGKTTSANVISEILACAGYQTLIIDLDPQMNLTKIYGDFDEFQINHERLFCEKLDTETLVESFVVSSDYENIHLIPATREYSDLIYTIQNKLKEDENSALIFRENLRKLEDYFDYIVIDNSPFRSTLTTCSICASDGVLTPIQMDNFSYDGVFNLIQNISDLNKRYELDTNFLGIFMTRVQARTNLFKGLYESYMSEFENKFIPISISQSNLLNEVNTTFTPLLIENRDSKPAKEYIELVNYLGLLDNEHYKILTKYINATKKKAGKKQTKKK